MPLLAELTLEGIGAGAIGTGVVALVVLLVVLQRLQDGRKAITEEVRRELKAGAEPQAVEVQSPLTVTPHVEYTPLDEHERLIDDFQAHRAEVDRRFQAMADASSASRQKIYDLIRDQTDKSAALVRETSSKVDQVSGQVTVLNQQLQQISSSLIQSAHERRHS